MKRGLLIFLAMSTFATAMVSRDRRAVNTEEEEELMRRTTTESLTSTAKMVCAPQTPCAWSIYKPSTKLQEMNITNTYCVCGPDTECQFYEDDSASSAYVYRCRAPVKEDVREESES